jgi:hypothetical protein
MTSWDYCFFERHKETIFLRTAGRLNKIFYTLFAAILLAFIG